MKWCLPLLAMVLLSGQVRAEERYEFYNGVRALGMGGAGVAVVNDETSLLVNPAGLGKLRDYFITIVDPEIEANSKLQTVAGLDVHKMNDPQTALDKLNQHTGDRIHERVQMFPSIVVPNFGFGIYGKYEVNSEVNTTTNLFEYDYTNDYAMAMGFNLRLFNGIIKIGAAGRAINRTEVRRTDIDPTSTTLSLKTLASSGLGVAGDAGIIISAPIRYLPTIAAVYRDIGRTTYTLRDGMFLKTDTDPTSTPETVDVAMAIFPIMGKRWRSTFTVEYRDVLTVSDETDQMRRTHGGIEFNYADAFFLRGGYHQRYWTAGFELAIINYQIQVASYGEEIGTKDAPEEDRRYVAKFAFRF
ncbi:MAG: hypothetical protein AB7F86_04470 [Bdellovibrionales bacterium]